MVRGILFFLWLASSWAALAADKAAAQTLPDGCPDIQGTYYCDGWNNYHQRQVGGHFQRFERVPDPDYPATNTTIYRVFRYKSPEEAKKARGSILVADGEKKNVLQTYGAIKTPLSPSAKMGLSTSIAKLTSIRRGPLGILKAISLLKSSTKPTTTVMGS